MSHHADHMDIIGLDDVIPALTSPKGVLIKRWHLAASRGREASHNIDQIITEMQATIDRMKRRQ